MEIFKSIIKFFSKNFIFFLSLVVLLSYGQLLRMYVWEDDNALFFKLANIEGKAGYLGEGPFGSGPYKYTATPYIPIYNLFGFETKAYFTFTLILYFISTVIVYKVLAKIFGEQVGKIAGFLYAAGYIASDGFIRLFNSTITNISVILISLLTYFYWKFYKSGKLIWYFSSVGAFFLAGEFAMARTHYLIVVIILFELLFLAFQKRIRSFGLSFLRIIPFLAIFYHYFVVNGDQRSGQVKLFIQNILDGQFYQSYSFFASITSVVLPNWLTDILYNLQYSLVTTTSINAPFIMLLTLTLFGIFTFTLFRNLKFGRILTFIFLAAAVIWLIAEESIFASPILNLDKKSHLLVFLGGIVLISSLSLFFGLKGFRKIYVFFLLWIVFNIAAYSAYNPTVYYFSINRYFAHSFFAIVALLAILYLFYAKTRARVFLLSVILFWGIGNIIASFFYQKTIVEVRSNPPRIFYEQLKTYVPSIQKGDIFYFDVAENASGSFREAFSVAQMPETTAIAWRYGIDRYDIKRFTSFWDFAKILKSDKVPPEKIHTFWYSKAGLINTSNDIRELLFQVKQSKKIAFDFSPDYQILFKEPLLSVSPVELTIEFEARAANPQHLSFAFGDPIVSTSLYRDSELRALAFEYQDFKKSLFETSKYQVSSEWRDRLRSNLFDEDRETFWQPDRVLWQKRNEYLTIDLAEVLSIDRLVWINGIANNTPTRYRVDYSVDGNNWQSVKSVENLVRIDTKNPQVVQFPEVNARFFRLVVTDTLGGDSPGVSEVWVVPSKFSDLNIIEAENFLRQPFKYVQSPADFNQTLNFLRYLGEAQIFWKNNNSEKLQTKENMKIQIPYNGLLNSVKILIPAGGTNLTNLKLDNFTILGKVNIHKITVRYPNINEL